VVGPLGPITYTEERDSLRTFAVSPQIETILGHSQEAWMAMRTCGSNGIHPEDRDRVVAACESANRTAQPYCEEYRMMTRDGQVLWIHDEAVLVRDSGGEPLCWQGVMNVIRGPG
jgi:PAS domain S-box-containing protein